MDKCLRRLASLCLIFSTTLLSAEPQLYQASSPGHRVALLELYTSEGCSSCPPADKWLSSLEYSDALVALAFHVTYWDYIGWQDRFADARYDDRQREIGRHNAARTIYTPQFVLNGKDYRGHNRFARDIAKLMNQAAVVDIQLSAELDNKNAAVSLMANIKNSPIKDVALYLALYENNLVSQIKDGENQGRELKHDYVVRQLYGPFIQSQAVSQQNFKQKIMLVPEWKRQDLNLVVFAQNPHSGEILQALKLALK